MERFATSTASPVDETQVTGQVDGDGESRNRHERDDPDRGEAAPGPAVRTLGTGWNIDASSLRVRLGLHTTPLQAGIRRKGESTLIVYQTKLEPLRETCGLARRPPRRRAVMFQIPIAPVRSAKTRIRLQSFNYGAPVGRATPG